MLFSVVLIARNEEKTLPSLLESLNEFKARGGKVLLCDTGSTDKTVEVAKSWGCEVKEVGEKFLIKIDNELAGKVNSFFNTEVLKDGDRIFDFASARNYITEFSPTNVVFSPDCDESYTKLDIDKINEAIKNGAEQLEYNFVFSHKADGTPAIKFRHCKAFDKRKLKWVNKVHEVLDGQANRVFLDEDTIYLEHFQNHETNRTGYLRGLALDVYENQANDRNSHYLGREFYWVGKYEAAIKELERHLTISSWKAERGQSMIYIGSCYEMLGKPEKALEWWFKGYLEEPTRREGLLAIADHYWRQNNHLQTAVFAEACLPIKGNLFYANDQRNYTIRPQELLYWACFWLGDKEKSKIYFDYCFEQEPYNEKFIHDSKFFYDFPKVSIVIPTYKRDTQPLLDSLAVDNYHGEKEIIVQKDETGEGCPKTFNKGVDKSIAELIVFLGDDTIVEKNWLNYAVLTYLKTGNLIALNDGRWHTDWNPKLASHFLAPKSLLKELDGKFLDERFKHYGCDDYLTYRVQKLNKLTYEHKAKIKETKMVDETSEKAFKSLEEDKKLLKELI